MNDDDRTRVRTRLTPMEAAALESAGIWPKVARVLVGLLVFLLVLKFVAFPVLERTGDRDLDPERLVDRLERMLTGAPAPAAGAGEQTLNQLIVERPIEEVRALLPRLPPGALDSVDAGMTPVMTAASAGRADLVEILVAHGADPNRRGGGERTALQYAAERNRIGAARALLAAGADVDGFDTTRLTPLVMAADRGHTELALLLIDAGADVDIQHVEGWTALIDAARGGNAALVERLLAAGADASLETTNGWRAIDYARHYEHPEVVRLLTRAARAPSTRTGGANE